MDTLLYDYFAQNSEKTQLEDDDYQTALCFCQLMGQQKQREKFTTSYVDFIGLIFEEDMRKMDISLVVKCNPVVIIEAKNEVGHGKVDSFMEVIGYKNSKILLSNFEHLVFFWSLLVLI